MCGGQQKEWTMFMLLLIVDPKKKFYLCYHLHETLQLSESTYIVSTLTRRHPSGGLTHTGRAEAQTLLLEPGPPLLLQLLLDLINLLS